MGILTPNNDNTNKVMQPQTTRWRFPYRSPRNSERLNQYKLQVHYDIARLYQKSKQLADYIDESNEIIWGDELVLDDADFTISWGNVEDQLSISEMALRIDKLNQRLLILERRL